MNNSNICGNYVITAVILNILKMSSTVSFFRNVKSNYILGQFSFNRLSIYMVESIT